MQANGYLLPAMEASNHSSTRSGDWRGSGDQLPGGTADHAHSGPGAHAGNRRPEKCGRQEHDGLKK